MRDPAAFYEVLFKVGNRPDADEHKNWMDGQPIMVKPRGAWLSPGEFKLWLDTGAMSVAANAVLMNRGREKHARVRAHAVAVLARQHKLKELAERLGIKEADAKTLVEDAKSWVNKGMTLGYDT
ncbi:MAG TPA: hypothetical protein VF653_10390, partial [Methylomirabilota bacterium]